MPEMTMEAFIETAPEGIKIALNTLVESDKQIRTNLIKTLSADENCTFEKEDLDSFTTNNLQKLAGTVKKVVPAENKELPADRSLQGGMQTNAKIPGEGDKLTEDDMLPSSPTINWKKEDK